MKLSGMSFSQTIVAKMEQGTEAGPRTERFWVQASLVVAETRWNQRNGRYRASIINRDLWSLVSLAHFMTH